MNIWMLVLIISLTPGHVADVREAGTPVYELVFPENHDVMLIDLNDPDVIVALPDGWII